MIKKNQREILELRNAVTKPRHLPEGIDIGLDPAEEKVCKSKDRPFEIIDSE